MPLSDQLSADASRTFLDTDGFAEAVTYTVSGGSPVSIQAVFGQERSKTSGGGMADDAEFRVGLADFTVAWIAVADIASPENGDVITRGATVYTVLQAESDGAMWKLALSTDLRANLI